MSITTLGTISITLIRQAQIHPLIHRAQVHLLILPIIVLRHVNFNLYKNGFHALDVEERDYVHIAKEKVKDGMVIAMRIV